MDDSIRLHGRLLATLALSALIAGVGCGSNGGASSSSSAAPAQENARAESSRHGSERVADRATAEPTAPEVFDIAPVDGPHGPQPFFCAKDIVGFDLSALQPTAATPIEFWYAWAYAQHRANMPGFVVAFSGMGSGPRVEARVGSVRHAGLGVYAFMERMPPTELVPVVSDPNNRFHVTMSAGVDTFGTAFGTEREREGFDISSITVEGDLDIECNQLRNAVVTMQLPKSNIGKHFGNAVVDEALGPMIVDTDNDGLNDSWIITMRAQSLDALKIRP